MIKHVKLKICIVVMANFHLLAPKILSVMMVLLTPQQKNATMEIQLILMGVVNTAKYKVDMNASIQLEPFHLVVINQNVQMVFYNLIMGRNAMMEIQMQEMDAMIVK